MNKFFIRKEAALIPALAAWAGLAGVEMIRNAGKSYTPGTGVAQALPVRRNQHGGQVMFDPRDNPQQYMKDMQELARQRSNRLAARASLARQNAAIAGQQFRDYMNRDYVMGDHTYQNIKNYVGDLNAKSYLLDAQLRDAEKGYNHVRPGIAEDAYMYRQGWKK